ncbi:MAG: ABC transporter ATP-binding protein [Myxococcota bacterium]
MIHVRDLCKSYDDRAVLRGVSLSIAAGERVALVGPNGSGKTTLMRALLGLVQATGTVSVAGHDPWRDHAAAQVHVAWVPQRAPALQVPVRELVKAWAEMRGLPEARLVSCAADFALDVGEVAKVRFAALSGGMQQKLLAAMALATDCPVLLFDEPTANLDPPARAVFLAKLAARAPAPTVLLSSHRMEEVRDLVDRVVVLTDGSVRFDDRLETFLADPDLASSAGLLAGGAVVPFRRSR